MHGKGEAKVNNVVLHLHPRVENLAEKLCLIARSVSIQQCFHRATTVAKGLVLAKGKLQGEETAFCCIPQVEGIVEVVLGNDCDHYLHCAAKTKEEFEKRVSAFNVESVKCRMKLNLTSFYNSTTISHRETDSIERILSTALSPYIHYQLSYLPSILQIIGLFTTYPVFFGPVDKKTVPYKTALEIQAALNDI